MEFFHILVNQSSDMLVCACNLRGIIEFFHGVYATSINELLVELGDDSNPYNNKKLRDDSSHYNTNR